MGAYCLIKDGSIVDGPRTLPINTNTVSGLNLLNDLQLKNLGWLPVEIEEREINPLFEKSTGIELKEIAEDKVIFKHVIYEYTVNERIEIRIKERIKYLKALADRRLRQQAIDQLKIDGTIPTDYEDQ